MRCRAELSFLYSGRGNAKMAAELLEMDNRLAPRELKIKTFATGEKVITIAEHWKLSTLAATLEDLIFTEKLVSELLEL